MPRKPIRLGLPEVSEWSANTAGELTDWRDSRYYRIDDYDAMEPFLVSLVSDSDLWMFISSRGGLTAGRKDADHSLFPYVTVDKLHVSHPHTGPGTVIRCLGETGISIWQPFADDGHMRYEVTRSIYKHILGCEIWFEERNLSLGLTFRYGWRPSDRFGWVRTAEILSGPGGERRLEILDGVRNLLPAGVRSSLQDCCSSLVDAYKYSECLPETMLAVYGLTANIIDRAEASEALRVTVAWQSGLAAARVLLDDAVRERFILGNDTKPVTELKGRRGSYLLVHEAALAEDETLAWHIVLDTPVDHARVVGLQHMLKGRTQEGTDSPLEAGGSLEEDIMRGQERLHDFLASADAFQLTGDSLTTAHHISNVLYNIARGGVLPDQYQVQRNDLTGFISARNRPVAERHAGWLAALPDSLPLTDLKSRAQAAADPDLIRLCDEYLPVVFSRRHGDPSRPWNRFSIVTKNADGSPHFAYQGNWRDIFQNWEALCRSFPECLESVVAKFFNASTPDGFNPYRIMREGIDWEVSDPDDPWSSIGYWGDHQIVYLSKILEASLAHHPERLPAMLSQDRFSYADVPYTIKPYADIVRNPQDTIVFDRERQRATDQRVGATGTDGKLVHRDGSILHVNLVEKLLVPILAKLSNLVPGGGIWMNTMRPEWNDANNALVGNGISVVTACYLYRHLGVCTDLIAKPGADRFQISRPVAEWLASIGSALNEFAGDTADSRQRRSFIDRAGEAFSVYREAVYAEWPGERTGVSARTVNAFLQKARTVVGATIKANRRSDHLYHAYNILHLEDGAASVSHLPLMLEGQVAALSSGLLKPAEALAVLETLRSSSLYREDQHSYLLYPEKQLPGYLARNVVPDSVLDQAPALKAMVESGDNSVVMRDADGRLRFHPDFHNAEALRACLGGRCPQVEVDALLDIYEAVFNHKAFTGRSGTMYGYEGIGCIYWHMIGKLLLATQEVFEQAAFDGADSGPRESGDVAAGLRKCYFDIRAGLGFVKSPAEFGAFPLDPYSHTPSYAGAKQPGMTGQVKEEILTRWGELGIHVRGGEICFRPHLLLDAEFLSESATFSSVDTDGKTRAFSLEPGSLAFTYCQIPIVYKRGDTRKITVERTDGADLQVDGNTLPASAAAEVFGRTGRIARVTVQFASG
jgi:hypothetical protein